MPKCRVCGAAHAACGPSTLGTVVAIDERVTLRKEGAVGDLKRYIVSVPSRGDRVVETTLLLSDEDAERQGLTSKDLAGKARPTNKAAEPDGTKSAAEQEKRGFFGGKK